MSSMLAAAALLVVVLLVMVVVVTVLVLRARRAPAADGGPVAAPGAGEARAEAAELTLALDEQVARSRTSLEFARIQLVDGASASLARAIDEGRAAGTELAHALASSRAAAGSTGTTHGPGGTAAAGQLAAGLVRARAAHAALSAAEAEVARATRRLDPPPA
ncbi:hypothetical protein V2J52_05025 [Georgenia sp. MJ173]|uniref:hypothetical protein n=1 Tax=Georgenia sunbinii TaxID=3117728 RepID=UPI002F26BCBD